MKKSKTQEISEEKLLARISGKAKLAAELIFINPEIQVMQEYANIVSIRRLGYNDHGPVHMRKAALNAIKMFHLLNQKNIKLNLETESIAKNEDSLVAIVIAALLHDMGMTVSRDSHELIGLLVAQKYIDDIIDRLYSEEDTLKKIAVKSIVLEGIFGHMTTFKIHSKEAGIVLVGDGCDMEEGRARIPTLLRNEPKAGDIHRHSASAIEKVSIVPGDEKPIRIVVDMSQTVGIFQVEEVLYPKILYSPIKPYIELYAQVKGEEILRYM